MSDNLVADGNAHSRGPEVTYLDRVRGVLLDVDGTLVDSNDAHAEAWVAALQFHGFRSSFEQVRDLIGVGSDKLLPKLTGLPGDSPEAEAISASWMTIFQERFLPHLRPTKGARELVAGLRERGLMLAIASSSEPELLDKLLQIAEAHDLIEERSTSGDAIRSKPDPDIIQSALGKLELEPSEVILVGDTPYDIEAGRKAGVRVVALRCGGWSDARLAGALAVYEDPADLLTNFHTAPARP